MRDRTAQGEPTLLKALLRARHWQKHSTFTREWDKAARTIDPGLVGTWPRHAQFYRWLRGELRERPYPDACRVLESLFPQFDPRELFEPCSPDLAATLGRHSDDNRSASSGAGHDVVAQAGISRMWPRTDPEVLDDLIARVNGATREISVFGLSRHYYAKDDVLPHFEAKAAHMPVTFYVMEPTCPSRRDRYRLEPVDAAMEDPARYTREALRLMLAASRRVVPTTSSAGLQIFTFNFPCSFAMEKIDDSCRVMLYGHGKRGTEGPMIVFNAGTPYWDYFDSQMQWIKRLATTPREPWTSKGLVVRPLREDDVAQ